MPTCARRWRRRDDRLGAASGSTASSRCLSREADTRALFVIGPDGTVIASDNWTMPAHAGRTQSRRPALFHQGGRVRQERAISAPSPTAIACAIISPKRCATAPRLLGVAVVRIEFDALEAAWQRAAEHVLVADSDGVVFLASDPAYKFGTWPRRPRPQTRRHRRGQALSRRAGIADRARDAANGAAPMSVVQIDRRRTPA